MKKVETKNGYDFYRGIETKKTGNLAMFWNIVPAGSPAPEGGYFNRATIEKVKGGVFSPEHVTTVAKLMEVSE